MPGFSLFRCGVAGVTHSHHRWMFGETFVCTDPNPPPINAASALNAHIARLRVPFGPDPDLSYSGSFTFAEQLFPWRRILFGNMSGVTGLGFELGPIAPEAAFRLQRVGAPGTGSSPKGRMTPPIRKDRFFTDLPHRRQVDVALLAPLLAANLGSAPLVVTSGAFSFTNVIFHRASRTWTPLHHYHLLPNPVRLWQRSRIYDVARFASADALWTPPEM